MSEIDEDEAAAAAPSAPSMLSAERQRQMIALLLAEGRCEVAALAERFSVTTETIRRDLKLLEQRGLVRRVHGGAILSESNHLVPGLPVRSARMAAVKNDIAHAALAYMPASGAVIFDAGTTTGRLAEIYPGGPSLTFLTNALPIAVTLAPKQGVTVHTVGGRVRETTLAEVDARALETLSRVSVDVAFVATYGVSAQHGFSTPDASEAAVKRAMIAAAKKVIVLADHSKLGQDHFARFADLTEPDLLITDAGISQEMYEELTSTGLDIEIAHPSALAVVGS